MTWDEIKLAFPNEWVAIVEYHHSGAIGVDGVVAAHAPEKKRFYSVMPSIREHHRDIAVRYTGKLIKNSKLPLLWQITNTK